MPARRALDFGHSSQAPPLPFPLHAPPQPGKAIPRLKRTSSSQGPKTVKKQVMLFTKVLVESEFANQSISSYLKILKLYN